ncbi:MAG: endo-1,4-beta-xylanase [Thermoguttaceae bacterium]|nr:endo-1,4-beta-xylanase [Thermoguttaceae bacterium]
MRRSLSILVLFAAAVLVVLARPAGADGPRPDGPDTSVMSQKYWEFWNEDVQKEIDARIEKYRKADAEIKLDGVAKGSPVKIEQIASDFMFGAHIFNFDQLGSDELNAKYKNVYGTLFNQATVAFYWKTLEPVKGSPRFEQKYEDTAEFWNSVKEPKKQPHWRRPAPDPVVAFCQSKGLQTTGHTIIWGNRKWQHPDWLPKDEANLDEMEKLFEKRIRELGERYGDRLSRWDVVNESSVDFGREDGKSAYGLMPKDYAYKAYTVAGEAFPSSVEFNINDYSVDDRYAAQVADLRKRGARIDNVGIQMHLFNPQDTLKIADGEPIQTPDVQKKRLTAADKTGLPLILSEITITAPNDDERGRAIQANVARNLYRYWFSWPTMRGITWWNIVDDCGAPGEPTTSGLFTRQMEPKPSYYALEQLILHEWRTNLDLVAESDGAAVKFRGFKGKYRATYKDAEGKERTLEFDVK